ncbi:MAG: sigma-70 family RNA polymerase sigma factor [bacterium]|nr:sigma-70 family RNA polymerase sigma factor [bacterium]
MPSQDEQELVRKFQAGDQAAFNDLVRKYQQPIYQVARRLLNSHEEAEDLSQDVFIKAFHNLKDFRSESSFYTWIYRIAVNLGLNVLRKRKIRQFFSLETVGLSIASKTPGVDQQMEKDEMVTALHHAIEKLPNKQKIVFTLRYFQNLPHAEIARILDRDEGTIKANYHLAVRKLQKAVKV